MAVHEIAMLLREYLLLSVFGIVFTRTREDLYSRYRIINSTAADCRSRCFVVPLCPCVPSRLRGDKVEAMAQLGGLICLQEPCSDGKGTFFFAGVDGVSCLCVTYKQLAYIRADVSQEYPSL